MTTPVTITVSQEGLNSSSGYALVNWGVTIQPPAVACNPSNFARLFVVRQEAGLETLDHVATTQDMSILNENELSCFEAKGPQGDVLLMNAVPNDILTLPGAVVGGTLDYWVQAEPPYTDGVFAVNGFFPRFSGSSSLLFLTSGVPQLQLSGYTFTADDIGRWVQLTGFVTNLGYNGYAQILSFVGSTATIGPITSAGPTYTNVMATEAGTAWTFYAIQVQPGTNPALEPRYFPSKVSEVAWQVAHPATPTIFYASNSMNGGFTLRPLTDELSRTQRFTVVAATLSDAINLKSVVLLGASQLQQAAESASGDFIGESTTTYGP